MSTLLFLVLWLSALRPTVMARHMLLNMLERYVCHENIAQRKLVLFYLGSGHHLFTLVETAPIFSCVAGSKTSNGGTNSPIHLFLDHFERLTAAEPQYRRCQGRAGCRGIFVEKFKKNPGKRASPPSGRSRTPLAMIKSCNILCSIVFKVIFRRRGCPLVFETR